MFEIGYRFNEFRVAGVPGAASLGSIKFKVWGVARADLLV